MKLAEAGLPSSSNVENYFLLYTQLLHMYTESLRSFDMFKGVYSLGFLKNLAAQKNPKLDKSAEAYEQRRERKIKADLSAGL